MRKRLYFYTFFVFFICSNSFFAMEQLGQSYNGDIVDLYDKVETFEQLKDFLPTRYQSNKTDEKPMKAEEKLLILSKIQALLKAKRNFYCPSDPFNDDFCDKKEIQLTSFMEAVSNPDIFLGSNEVSLNDLVDECINYNPALFYSIPRRSFYQIKQEIEKDCRMSFGLWSEKGTKENEAIHTAELYRKMAQELFLISFYAQVFFKKTILWEYNYPDRFKPIAQSRHLDYALFLCGFDQSINSSDMFAWFGNPQKCFAIKAKMKLVLDFFVYFTAYTSFFENAKNSKLLDEVYTFESCIKVSADWVNHCMKQEAIDAAYCLKKNISTFDQCRLLYEIGITYWFFCFRDHMFLTSGLLLRDQSASNKARFKKFVLQIVEKSLANNFIMKNFTLEVKNFQEYGAMYFEHREKIITNLECIRRSYDEIKSSLHKMNISTYNLFDNYGQSSLASMRNLLKENQSIDQFILPHFFETLACEFIEFEKATIDCENIVKDYKKVLEESNRLHYFSTTFLSCIKDLYEENAKLCERLPFWKYAGITELDDFISTVFLRRHFVRFLKKLEFEKNKNDRSVNTIEFKTFNEIGEYFTKLEVSLKHKDCFKKFLEKLVRYLDNSRFRKNQNAINDCGVYRERINTLINSDKHRLNKYDLDAIKYIIIEDLEKISSYCSFENQAVKEVFEKEHPKTFEKILDQNILFLTKNRTLNFSIESPEPSQKTEVNEGEKTPDVEISNQRWQEYLIHMEKQSIGEQTPSFSDKGRKISEGARPEIYDLFTAFFKKVRQAVALQWLKSFLTSLKYFINVL